MTNRRLVGLRSEITRTEDRLDELLNLYLDRKVDDETYARKRRDLTITKRGMENELESASQDQEERGDAAIAAFELADQLAEKWVTADVVTKRLIIETVCLNIAMKGVTIDITATSPFDLLLKEPICETGRSERI